MGKQKNALFINGKEYNSKTGTLVIDSSVLSPVQISKNLDGFFRVSRNVASQTINRRHNINASAKLHSKRQHSKTLMRAAVSKPNDPKPKTVTYRLEPDNETAVTATYTDNAKNRLKAERSQKSKTISKSEHISRFYFGKEPTLTKKTEPLEVKISQSVTPIENIHVGVDELAPEPNDIFTNAINHATSHEQASPKRAKSHHKAARKLRLSKKSANIGAISLAALILMGFIAYQNQASIRLRVADSKAGIHASLPSYKPAGFAFSNQIGSSPGQIVLSFHSNSDDRGFKVTQTASDWNSQTLLDSYVTSADSNYQQVSQNSGKSIFLYGDANATWVDGGVWYKIEGNSNLSSDQLLKIANSF